MILTYKIKHNSDFRIELAQAVEVAKIALETRTMSTTAVKHIGLKSAISNQILRKYSRNKKIKKISSVPLTIPGNRTKQKINTLYIPCIKLSIDISYIPTFLKVNQVEINHTYAFVSVTVEEKPEEKIVDYLGVDRNATGHVVVASLLNSGEVLKLGKQALHLRKKYQGIRKHLQKTHQFKILRSMKNKEQRVLRDIDHKISRSIVDFAVKTKSAIVFEKLLGINKGKKKLNKTMNRIVKSWSFYRLEQYVLYKAKLAGVKVVFVDPSFTSQICFRCKEIGSRVAKKFMCSCGHIEHADVNASFNIALRGKGVLDHAENEVCMRGGTGSPKKATHNRKCDLKPVRKNKNGVSVGKL